MLNLEQLCALPQAGRALLVAHRWLMRQDNPATTAFDLLASIGGLAALNDQLPLTLAAIAADDEGAHTMLSLLGALFALDRIEAVSKSLGLSIKFPEEQCAEFWRLLCAARRSGGAS